MSQEEEKAEEMNERKKTSVHVQPSAQEGRKECSTVMLGQLAVTVVPASFSWSRQAKSEQPDWVSLQ